MQFPTWIPQMLTSSRSGRCGGENYIYAGDGYLLKRQNNTIKCTPWSTRLRPQPTKVKKMRTFLEIEEKMGPIPQPASSQYRPPLSQTQTLIPGRIRPQRRDRGQHPPRDSGLTQHPGQVKQLCTHLQQFSPQFVKALHGLVQERCQKTSSRKERIGCFLPTA